MELKLRWNGSLCFLLFNLPFIITDLSSDRNALLEFAASVPHLKKLNWNSSVSLCTSWVGITCSENRVIALHLPGVGLYGTIPPNTIGKLDALRVLSLHSNTLYGNLSSDILSLPSLKALYLQHNNLSGSIPPFISPRIRVIDLSFNSFSGFIPTINLPRLKLLNLSYNLLDGPIPVSWKNLPISSFMGNPLLCGSPLPDCSSVPPSSLKYDSTSNFKIHGVVQIIGIAIGGCVILFLLLSPLLCFLKKKKSGRIGVVKKKVGSSGRKPKPEDFGSGIQEAEKNKLVFFEGSSYNFDLEDLLRASAEVLGIGGFGAAYKVVLDEETTVVVKRLKEVWVGKKEFEQHMENLGRIGKNPNVVPLLAYYYSKDEKFLVYEYMPNSSLSSLLHGNKDIGRTPLDWESRKKISIGAAKGIAHIHSLGGDKYTHGNIKSSNVLLNKEFDGCMSDIGLTPLINIPANMSRGAGYRAPEAIETAKFTQESDVYSFGVVLLEMLTCKTPIQFTRRAEAIDLPRWVRSVVQEEWTAEVFDVELLRFRNIEEELVQMLQIALACVEKVADIRPTMDEVVRLIEEVGQSAVEKCPSSVESKSSLSNVQTP